VQLRHLPSCRCVSDKLQHRGAGERGKQGKGKRWAHGRQSLPAASELPVYQGRLVTHHVRSTLR
jgi:hypothetical protein